VYWGREEEEEEEVLLPPRWRSWQRDDEPDDMPKFWHREPLVHSRGGYVDNVSPVYLAGLLANRAQLFRQACSAASFKLVQYVDGSGRPEVCIYICIHMHMVYRCVCVCVCVCVCTHKVMQYLDGSGRPEVCIYICIHMHTYAYGV
jgi:hypothetical protein